LFLFYRLLLAHLVADFPFQSTRLFRLKTESIKGIILHGCIFGVLAVALSYPCITNPLLGIYLLLLAVFHIFLDWLKVKLTNYTRKDSLSLFILDQVLHIISIAIVIPFNVKPPYPSSLIARLYSDDRLIIFCIFYIISSFVATILIYYLKKAYRRQEIQFPRKGKYYEILERILITTLIVLPGYFFFLVPLEIAIKGIICWKNKFNEDEYDFSRFNLIVSPSIAIAAGIILRQIL